MTEIFWNRQQTSLGHMIVSLLEGHLCYMQKSNGDRIAPCGTPWVVGRAADKDEPMQTF
jgi:hypothetical protein